MFTYTFVSSLPAGPDALFMAMESLKLELGASATLKNLVIIRVSMVATHKQDKTKTRVVISFNL